MGWEIVLFNGSEWVLSLGVIVGTILGAVMAPTFIRLMSNHRICRDIPANPTGSESNNWIAQRNAELDRIKLCRIRDD